MRNYRGWKVLKAVVLVGVGVTFFGFVVERLWNWLLPPLMGVRAITFVQAIGLLVLSRILFGGFHRHGGGGRRWKRGLEERWNAMSADERESFRSGLRGRSGCNWKRPEEAVAERSAP